MPQLGRLGLAPHVDVGAVLLTAPGEKPRPEDILRI